MAITPDSVRKHHNVNDRELIDTVRVTQTDTGAASVHREVYVMGGADTGDGAAVVAVT